MAEYRQLDDAAREAGGVLLGRVVLERPDVVVETVTVPVPDDHRSRYQFVRAAEPTQAAIDEAWESSGGLQNFLGEWHTHPEDRPNPSSVDRKGWERMARTARFEQDALFFVIVGRVDIGAWEVKRGGRAAVRLERAHGGEPEDPESHLPEGREVKQDLEG